jgi:hypothetical protein
MGPPWPPWPDMMALKALVPMPMAGGGACGGP